LTDLKPDCEDRIIVALHNMAAEKSDWRSGFSGFEADNSGTNIGFTPKLLVMIAINLMFSL
jgi:hypothetical protein